MATTIYQETRHGGPTALPGKEVRCGAFRETMKTNPLLTYAGVGQVRKSLFHDPSGGGRAFGVQKPRDPEGAREVTSNWKEHKADPADLPGPDFRAMNKLAAKSGITRTEEQRTFRSDHPIRLRVGSLPGYQCAPKLPSNKAEHPAFGGPSDMSAGEGTRTAANVQTSSLGTLIQASYAQDWIRANQVRAAKAAPVFIKPGNTLASTGHGTHVYGTEQHRKESVDSFKMPRFLSVGPRTITRRYGTAAHDSIAAQEDAFAEASQ